MSLIRRIIGKIVRSSIQSSPQIKHDFFWLLVECAKKDPDDFRQLLAGLKKELGREYFSYPSVFNQGYLHIDRVTHLARCFKLDEKNCILDVGAADGITPEMFSKAFPESVVYAFEPIPSTFQQLHNRVSANKKIVSINKGLSSKEGQMTIHLASRITSSSLYEIEKNIANKFFAENIKDAGSEQVSLSTLDREIPFGLNINIFKMDVQGYELEVLKGGHDTLKRTAIVLLEMQNHELYVGAPKYFELDSYLRERGFELYDIIPSIRQDNKLYEWDSIYINKNILK